MREVLHQVSGIAQSPCSVHIHGESGTGKERIAHAIHRLSARRSGPFVAVNVSAIGESLFESALFGHVRGSFTGAVADHPGHVAEAENGTLFLDEVTELSHPAQVKLLRFLQEWEYHRIGETRVRRARVRLVTAGNVALAEREAQGRIREDIRHRLEILTLTLPPLRERIGDIPLLARHLLAKHATIMGWPTPALDADVLAALEQHSWPGNVRELESEIQRLLVRAGRHGVPRLEHVSASVRSAARRADSLCLRSALQRFERSHIGGALERCQGHRTRTAQALGITRQALAVKLSRLGL
jgi:transcriptional regulator with PAS, ATPase and Fis domain